VIVEADSGKHSAVLAAEVGDIKDDEKIYGAEFPIDHWGTANAGTEAEIHIVKSGSSILSTRSSPTKLTAFRLGIT